MGGIECTDLVQEGHTILSCTHGNEPLSYIICREFLD
jgi:hypothetical protein